MKQEYTLRELLELGAAESYYSATVERFSLARYFMNFMRNYIDSREENKTKASINMNLDTLCVKIERNDLGENQYIFSLKNKPVDENNPFDNFAYVGNKLLQAVAEKGLTYSKHVPSKKDKIQAVAIILFEILFACHPYKGNTYFTSAVESPEKELEFFTNSKLFIFDDAVGKKIRINGYHDVPFALWEMLSEGQKSFLKKGISGAVKKEDFASFYDEWYVKFKYKRINYLTQCGQEIFGLEFEKDDFVLFATDIFYGKNEIICYSADQSNYRTCAKCTFAEQKVKAVSYKARVTLTNAGLGRKATESTEKEISIKVGMEITGRDLDKKNGGDEVVFTVIPSKKINTIGLHYTGDQVVTAVYPNKDVYMHENDAKFVIAPGTAIYLAGNLKIEIL